ncbi:MAG: glucokinase [Bergeyella sp.]|nr:glucokinase [Bergeyella sp.]
MSHSFSFSLHFPSKHSVPQEDKSVLAVDIRPHRVTFGKYLSGRRLKKEYEESLSGEGRKLLEEVLGEFLSKRKNEIFHVLSIAVPGPVIHQTCETKNLPWTIDAKKLKQSTGIEKVCLLNDSEAYAYSLEDTDLNLQVLNASQDIPSGKISGNMAVLAPGDGLGEAGLFWDGNNLRPFATEGGHCEFSPRTDVEVEFYHFLNKINGIVTWENVLSKEGIYNIYRFLRDVGRHEEESWLKEKAAKEDFLEVLSEVGKSKKSRLVNLTIEFYAKFLSREANSLALKLKATGGLIITGEITEKLYGLWDKEKFYKDFIISEKMNHLLKNIPLCLLKNADQILKGAAYYGLYA